MMYTVHSRSENEWKTKHTPNSLGSVPLIMHSVLRFMDALHTIAEPLKRQLEIKSSSFNVKTCVIDTRNVVTKHGAFGCFIANVLVTK